MQTFYSAKPLKWRILVVLGLFLITQLTAGLTASSQAAGPVAIKGPRVVLIASGENKPGRISAPRGAPGASAKTATISVSYSGFTAQSQAAFQYAVDIWSTLVASSIEIKVVATFEPLSSGVLGAAGPRTAFTNFSNQPIANTFYPIALANKLAGVDLDPANPDIDASFNSSFSDWYFGTDGLTPNGKYDFVSVVLHELCHGLGFVDSTNKSGDVGSYGVSSPVKPLIYDRFLVNGLGQSLTNTSLFPNPSTSLGSQLINNLFFDGPKARAANSGSNPSLYSPNPYQAGSSIAHLGEVFNNTVNTLMTFSINAAEAVHIPGPVTLGIMQDMGWQLAPPNAPSGLTATTISPSQINLAWVDNSKAESGFRVERKTGLAGTFVEITSAVGPNITTYSDSGLTAGTVYFYRVRSYSAEGNSAYSNQASTITPGALVVTVIEDKGDAIDADTAGTLSYALKRVVAGQAITFALTSGNTVLIKGTLRNVPASVTIGSSCNSGPGIILDGFNVPTLSNGLNLPGGATLHGLNITRFKGDQLKISGKGNLIACVVAKK